MGNQKLFCLSHQKNPFGRMSKNTQYQFNIIYFYFLLFKIKKHKNINTPPPYPYKGVGEQSIYISNALFTI